MRFRKSRATTVKMRKLSMPAHGHAIPKVVGDAAGLFGFDAVR